MIPRHWSIPRKVSAQVRPMPVAANNSRMCTNQHHDFTRCVLQSHSVYYSLEQSGNVHSGVKGTEISHWSRVPSCDDVELIECMILCRSCLCMIVFQVTFLVVLFALPSSSSCEDAVGATSCDIFCSGLILQTIQFGGFFNDSKTFVDMPLTRHPQCVKDDFESMEDYSKERSKQQKILLMPLALIQPACLA